MLQKENVCVYVGGIVAGLTISAVMYVVKALGAGDVKLIAVLGGMLGFNNIIAIIIISMALGGVVGMCEILLDTTRNAGLCCGKVLHGFHYSIGILSGVLFCICKIWF